MGDGEQQMGFAALCPTYGQIRFQMQRFRELMYEVGLSHEPDEYLASWERVLREDASFHVQLFEYEAAFRTLDEQSWSELKRKAIDHYSDHRKGHLKQGFFNQLNEAFAYEYLFKLGADAIQILSEASLKKHRSKQADLSFVRNGSLLHCEVKSLGTSDEDFQRFEAAVDFDPSCYSRLGDKFFSKLSSALDQAKEQIASSNTEGIRFLVIRFDDFTLRYLEIYKLQLLDHLKSEDLTDVVVKIMRTRGYLGLEP